MFLMAALAATTLTAAEMAAVSDAFDRAQLTQDSVKLDVMVDDELVFIDGAGKRQGKREFIEGWVSPADKYGPIVLIDRKMTPLSQD